MNIQIRSPGKSIGVAIVLFAMANIATADTELRTLQSWNLPHPFQGPKSLTENVLSNVIHPSFRTYAKNNNVSIGYSKEDDCLIINGNEKELDVLEGSLAQLSLYQHPYAGLFGQSERSNDKRTMRFPTVCATQGGTNLLRLELEYLPVVPRDWEKPVRYGMKEGTYKTLGTYRFPTTISGAKEEKEIEGELLFKHATNGQPVHILSYRGMSKEDLQAKLQRANDEARIYIDVPYNRLLNQDASGSNQWALYRAGSKALKLLCPNYNNEKLRALFADKSYRRILQKAVDLVYHLEGIGITDTGLQPVHQQNVLEFSSWRKYSASMLEKKRRQLRNEWKVWLASQQKDPSPLFDEFFYIDNNQLFDYETDELPEVKVFFADVINDQTFFENLKEFLNENHILNLRVNSWNDFIWSSKFRKILGGQAELKDGHEGIVFDVPIPYNDHIEHYFSTDKSFFGLEKSIAPKLSRQVSVMLSGEWNINSTKRLGRLLRDECPCLIIGQHPFYVYTRKVGDFSLPDVEVPEDAPTAYRLSERISHTTLN